MTYDPNNPNRRVARDGGGMSGGLIAGILMAVALAVGILFYVMTREDRTASTSSPPATTGQSQKAPAPAPSNPAPAPNPKAQ